MHFACVLLLPTTYYYC